jgi:mono/diheme cytochrome c family protein
MARRWLSLTLLSIGCQAGWAGSARSPEKLEPSASRLSFTSQLGTAPPGKVVTVQLREDAPPPPVRVAYQGVGGWLSAGIVGTGERRSLSVQPISYTLGPGVYRATVAVGERNGAASLGRVEVTLAVLGASHTACPPGSTLRYAGGGDGQSEPADFGRRFFAKYCTACHASRVEGAARRGAPPELDWDTLEGIRAQRHWIDAVAAREADSVEDAPPPFVMPPAFVAKRPTQAERDRLARWIACGAP